MIILPGTIDYTITLDVLPIWWTSFCNKQDDTVTIIRPGSNGLAEQVSLQEAREYLHDGELDARLDEIEVSEFHGYD